MKFYIGQTVELVNNDQMAAKKGATAVVVGVETRGIEIKWLTKSKNQISGFYFTNNSRFRPLVRKGEQLEFSFMDEVTYE